MQKYPVRASHRSNLTGDRLGELLRAHFDSSTVEGTGASTRYGAISSMTVGAAGKDLSVALTMDPKVPEDVARETIRRYNAFLEEATGFSAKERAKRLRKAAQSSSE